MDFLKKHHEWIPALVIAIILGMTLPFKFGGAAITDHIFDVVGAYLGLGFFQSNGSQIIGALELITVIMVLMPASRALGAVLGMGLMGGAIFFHLFSPLGTTIEYMDENGVAQADGDMFYMAILVFVSALYLAFKNKDSLPIIGSKE